MTYFPQGPSPSVSSALRRFTSVFGMGTGGTTSLQLPGGLSKFKIQKAKIKINFLLVPLNC